MLNLYMLVARQYLQRRENDELVEDATRHWAYHGPDSKESCEKVKKFVETDPDNTWDTFYEVVSVEFYNECKFE